MLIRKKNGLFLALLCLIFCNQQINGSFTPSITAVFGQPFETTFVANTTSYTPNGKFFTLAGDSGFFIFTVASNGSLNATEGSPFYMSYTISDSTYSPNGDYLTAINTKTMPYSLVTFLVNKKTGNLLEISTNSMINNNPINIQYSSNGKFLASLSDTLISIFSINTNGSLTILRTYPVENCYSATNLSFSPHEKFLAVSTFNVSLNTIKLQNIPFNKSTGELNFSQAESLLISSPTNGQIAYSPSSSYIAQGYFGGVFLYFVDEKTGALEQRSNFINSSTGGNYVSFSPDSQFLLTGPVQGREMYILVVEKNGILRAYFQPINTAGPAVSLSFSPLYTNGNSYFSWYNSGTGSLQDKISSYVFSLTPPMGLLTSAIRNKYLFNK